MSSSNKRVCLVSMPFTPVAMPALGVSTLKATLTAAGIESEVYYGAFDFLRVVGDGFTPAEVFLDYSYIASDICLGDILFSQALSGGSGAAIHEVIDTLATGPNAIFSLAEMERITARIRVYVERIPAFLEHCCGARDWDRYDIVGFSSSFAQNICSLAAARALRERHPGIHVVFGGANCEGDMGEQILRSFPQVDSVIRGEADFSFPQFVQRRRSGAALAEIPGIVYREGTEVRIGASATALQQMDDLPYPDFDDYFAQRPPLLAENRRIDFSLPIETSRGCWWGAIKHCTFCGLNPSTMTFRVKSPARALSEFRYLAERYGHRSFYVVDNIISKKYFKDVLPDLEGSEFRIFYETKSNLTEAEVQQLARAGVAKVQPGIEGLSSEILELMKKGVKGYQNVELLKWCAMYGVAPHWFYLYGFPDEPTEAYLRDAALMERLSHLPPPKNPNPVLLDRYSPLFMRRDEYGLRNVRPVSASRVYYQGLTDAERFRIAYHFEMELPQGNHLPYVNTLWTAVMHWRYENARGARFYQFEGDRTTLLLDTRRGRLSAALLTGAGHLIHHTLRRARTAAVLFDEVQHSDADLFGISARDLLLTHVAAELGAQPIQSPGGSAELPEFLDDLAERWIVLPIDGRHIALAVDCMRSEEAAPYGLGDFVRALPDPEASRSPAERVRGRNLSTYPTLSSEGKGLRR